jgi:competence protein ComEA
VDTDLESFIEKSPSEAELRAEVRASTWYYVALTALVSLLVGAAIGRFGQNPMKSTNMQTPPTIGSEQACAPQPSTDAAVAKEPTVAPTPLNIYVSGAISEPQVITVPAGSLVADALDAVGGVATHADLDAVNLAAPLADHQQILIPGKTEVCPPTESKSDSAIATISATTEKIDLNTATKEELQTLTGIGASRAQDIIAYREANGSFQHIEEIQYVSGIGEGIFAQIEAQITVGSGQD